MEDIEFEYGNMEYRISSSGLIFSYSVNRFLKYSPNGDGYPQVSLGSRKYRKFFGVHRLVAKYFVDNPNNYPEVNHKDFDRTNYDYNNLEWCTHQQNIAYSVNAKRMFYHKKDVSGENNNNFGNRKLSKIYSENPDYAKEKQSRPKEQNGRCRKVKMVDSSGTELVFNYIFKCSQYLESLGLGIAKNMSAYITKSANSGKKYKGFNFYFI